MKKERYDLEGTHTPWGATQSATEFAPGIVFHGTAGHGGFHLDRQRMKMFDQELPDFQTFAGGPWFEEDCDAAVIACVFPDAFDRQVVTECIQQVRSMAASGYERFPAVVEWLNSRPQAA
jgi:hypothetical protein